MSMAEYLRHYFGEIVKLALVVACGILPILIAGCVTGAQPASKVEYIKITEYQPGPEKSANSAYMFSADWCEPCKIAKPIMEKEAAKRGDRVVIVDSTDFRIMDKLGYKSLPVFRFTKVGSEKDATLTGWDEKKFLETYRAF